MAVKIGSNISSLQAQRRLGEATSSLSKTYEKLSSGQRMNRASDDAAGLAISMTLNAKSKIFTQGLRNLNDGLSYTAIAGGAIKELKGILYRQRELATQASNGTYSDKQRDAMERELQELSSEWNRVLDSTSFNGLKIFSSKEGSLTLQAGVGESDLLDAGFGSREAATQDDLVRMSTARDGSEGNADAGPGILSADGRYFAFYSSATNLIAGDTADAAIDIFLTDRQTGETTKVTSSASGGAADANSFLGSFSADGRYLAFESNASNLVEGDISDGVRDLFVRDLLTNETTKITASSSGGAANESSYSPVLSADGRYVVFSSAATNLIAGDTGDSVDDIFLKDLQTGETIKITSSTTGGAANNPSMNPVLSADGRYLAFSSRASNLIPGDTADVHYDIFVRDLQTQETEKITKSASGGAANSSTFSPTLSSDGRYVAFSSAASNLIAGDTPDAFTDIFLTDRQTGETMKITSAAGGGGANGGSGGPRLAPGGRYLVFQSDAENLIPNDTPDGRTDIFVKDLHTGELAKITRSASGGGTDNTSGSASFSADGRYISFYSYASNLVPGDSGLYSDNFIIGNPFVEWSRVSRNQWLSVRTGEEALKSQSRIDNYLAELNTVEGSLGSIEARLGTAASNLRSMTENFRAAESRIGDADMCQEAANLTRTQIVQQAASAILAQANQQPTIALSLLRGVG